MSELDRLVSTLKQRLKAQGITYRELGTRLGLSEASVKRMFASRRFSLDRLLEISHLLGFSLAELAQEAALSGTRLHTLGEGQERELVSDEKLLLVAVCVLNHWTMDEILHTYRLSEAECIQRLARLDRLRLLDLLPGNRVRLNVARDFDWLPGGPIRNFFRRQGLVDFLGSDFAGTDEVMAFFPRHAHRVGAGQAAGGDSHAAPALRRTARGKSGRAPDEAAWHGNAAGAARVGTGSLHPAAAYGLKGRRAASGKKRRCPKRKLPLREGGVANRA
ncbi:helix-turn-helix domain-containing protein [Azotobacter vinelandii]